MTYLQIGVYWGYNPLIQTIDPNFQYDFQVEFWREIQRLLT